MIGQSSNRLLKLLVLVLRQEWLVQHVPWKSRLFCFELSIVMEIRKIRTKRDRPRHPVELAPVIVAVPLWDVVIPGRIIWNVCVSSDEILVGVCPEVIGPNSLPWAFGALCVTQRRTSGWRLSFLGHYLFACIIFFHSIDQRLP